MKQYLLKLCLATTLFIIATAFIPGQSSQQSTGSSTSKKWISLFDGNSFKGWHFIPGGEWKVENGVIVGSSKKEDQRHGLLVTDSVFNDFEVQIEYKAITGNSGLYFRVDEVGGVVGVHGFQAEIDPERDAGGLYETGGREWVVKPSAAQVKKWYKPDAWNKMTVKANKSHIVVHVNGYKTAELLNDSGRSKGHIALQLHGGMDMYVLFRDIKIRML